MSRSLRRGGLGLDRGLTVAKIRIAQLDRELLLEPRVADASVAMRDPRLAGLEHRSRWRHRDRHALAQPARVLALRRRLVVGDQVARAARRAGLGGEHDADDVVDVEPRRRGLAVIEQAELALAQPFAQTAARAIDRR